MSTITEKTAFILKKVEKKTHCTQTFHHTYTFHCTGFTYVKFPVSVSIPCFESYPVLSKIDLNTKKNLQKCEQKRHNLII